MHFIATYPFHNKFSIENLIDSSYRDPQGVRISTEKLEILFSLYKMETKEKSFNTKSLKD